MLKALSIKSLSSISSRHFSSLSYFRSSASTNYDIVIVGAGIAGSSLACSISSSPLLSNKKVALVDASPLKKISQWLPPTDRFSNRTVQITAANQKFLSSIGIWDQLYQERVQPYSNVIVSDQLSGSKLTFDSISLSLPDNQSSAYLVENSNLHAAALKALSASITPSKKIDIYQDAKVLSISNSTSDTNDWPLIQLSTGNSLKARLLIGTDGINSFVRKYANIDSQGWDYNQFGLVANLIFDKLNTTAYQRFLPSGPIAVLPLPNGFANLVWSLDTEIASKLKLVSDELFVKFVNLAFRLPYYSDFQYLLSLIDSNGNLLPNTDFDKEALWRLNKTPFDQNNDLNLSDYLSNHSDFPPNVIEISTNSRQTFPLRLRIADKFYSNRVALLGDAAHTVHPLAGQGLNAGLSDVISLVNILKDAVRSGSDIGSSTNVLRKYNSERYWPNAALQGSIDKLWRIFRSKNPIIYNARKLGIDFIEKFPALKNKIVQSSMF
ncbi:Ubiquinone biosynthesis monooxygenase COQ6, mitochondrial [Smittium culicis]|uniref:Ubiquinone biosynthesis monooxygenase COQ6, mitochondrial n=1 Tax=Smittium culicis TaxID=133412 RepID=A0A1R1XWE7_9FUNG|nr:Ubiquinone biosynthesis monooxygenase COQ6, mitochondrial [Smittium culicis]